jgi:hypothetical protein
MHDGGILLRERNAVATAQPRRQHRHGHDSRVDGELRPGNTSASSCYSWMTGLQVTQDGRREGTRNSAVFLSPAAGIDPALMPVSMKLPASKLT